MAFVTRKDPYLDEVIQLTDPFFEKADNNQEKAYASLPQSFKDFVDKEMERCLLDVRYYLENYHVINSKTEGFKTLYPFWDSQDIFIDKIYNLIVNGKAVKVVVLKARQLGLSTISEGILFWKTIFHEGCNSLVVAQEQKQADYLFGMCRLAYDYLPWWMRPEVRYDSKGKYLMFDRNDPDQRMTHPGLRSQILVDYANKISGLAGVGKTIHAVHISEYSSFSDPGVLTEGIFPTMTSNALAVIESTARGRRNSFHEFWKNAVEGDSEWIPVFIESFRIKDYYLPIEKDEEFQLTPEEKGIQEKVKDNTGYVVEPEHFKWKRAKLKEYTDIQGEEGEAMMYQEYPSVSWQEAFQGSGLCAFNKKRLHEIMQTDCRRPIAYGEIELKDDKKTPKVSLVRVVPGVDIPSQKERGGRLYIWEMPLEGETYYIGADVAHGNKGGDFSDSPIYKIGHRGEPDEQVAEWHGWISPTPYGYTLAAMGYWYNEAQIAVECNDVGILTDQVLFRELDYPNIFRWKHYDKIKNFNTDFLGWYTNAKTRDMIIAKMRERLDERGVILRSEEAVDELIDFAQDEIGARFEGQAGNDDRCFGHFITNFCAHDSDFGQQAAAAPRTSHARLGSEVKFDHQLAYPLACKICMTPTVLAARFGPRLERTLPLCDEHRNRETLVRILEEEERKVDFANSDFSPVYDQKQRQSTDNVFFGSPVIEAAREVPRDYMMHSSVDTGRGAQVALDELWKLL